MNPLHLLLLLILSLGSLAAAATPGEQENAVVAMASIKPLAFIHAALRPQDAGGVQVLLPDNRNLHDYTLTISDIRRVQAAPVVFWLGAGSEPHLARLQKRLAQDNPARQQEWVALAASPSHAWLDTRQLPAMVNAMAEALGSRYPQEKAAMDARAAELLAAVAEHEAGWRQQLAPYAGKPFLLGHDAFTAFAANLGLQGARLYRSGNDHGHLQAGMKELLVMQQQIEKGEIGCAMQEPEVNFRDLAKRYPALRVGYIEPMGANIAINADGYIRFLDATAGAFLQCLEGRKP